MFIDKVTKLRVNEHSAYKGFSKLDTPEIRERAGLVEIPDPIRGDDLTHFNQEINEYPYLVVTQKPADMLARQEQGRINQEALAYLASTDWLVIRAMESGVAVAPEVQLKRSKARASVVPEKRII